MGTDYNPKIVTNGLVLCLDAGNVKSYPGTGTTWTDLSGGGAVATLTAGVSYTSNYLTFNGSSGYGTVPGSTAWAFGANGSAEAWAYVTAYGGNSRLWCVMNNNISLDAYVNAAGKFYMHGDKVGVESPLFGLSAWRHVVVTYTAGAVAIYFNGAAQTIAGTQTTGYNITNAGTLYIGEYSGSRGYYWNGRISTVRMYNRALSAAEITQNFNASRKRFGL